MKYLKLLKLAIPVLALLAFSSCDKVTPTEDIGGAGETFVKFMSDYNLINVDFVPTDQKAVLFDLRRDAPNNTALNTEMTVIVTEDFGIASTKDPAYIPFPAGIVNINYDATTTRVGNNITMKMKAGDFAKELTATVKNANTLNLTSKYGTGFKITTVDANGKITAAPRTVVVEIGAKNQFDGVYQISGTFVDVTNPAFTSDYPFEYALVTSGPNTCDVINLDLNGGIPGYLFLNAGTGTFYGAFGWVVTFDPASGAITDWHNYYGDPSKAVTGGGNPAAGSGAPLYAASNTRRATLDPSGTNSYDFSQKKISVKHYLLHPAVMGNNNPRSFFNETWTYIRPR